MTPNETGPLGFKYWPFDIVPKPDEPLVWADRTALKAQILMLARRLGRHPGVSLHLLWADFGAGKTHTLLYLKQVAETGQYGSILPLYCALPKGCRSFLDVYRALVRAIPVQLLQETHQEALSRVGRDRLTTSLRDIWINLPICFSAIAIGGDLQQRTAVAWLQAETGIPANDLRRLSMVGRIKSTEDAVLALRGIVRLFNLAGRKQVLFMIDEFQRVEVLRRQEQDEINAGLHGLYNACGSGMSLLLSFSFGVEANIKHFLNPELLSRADPQRISIPVLAKDEGVVFLNEVIAQARASADDWPVAPDVVPALVNAVADKFALTPRRLLKAGGLVFDLAEMALEDGSLSQVTGAYVRDMAARGEFSRIDQQESEE